VDSLTPPGTKSAGHVNTDLALMLTNEVIRAKTPEDAHLIALKIVTHTNRPSLVLGDANFLDAVYPVGRKEPITYTC
jgi:hypothetical protein